MAFFGRKKTGNGTKGNAETKRVTSGNFGGGTRNLSSILVRPRITEKSARLNEQNIYTFVVRKGATKYDVRDAIRQTYNVIPRKITIVNRPPRATHLRSRSRTVTEPGMRKASVYLKKGDRIDLV